MYNTESLYQHFEPWLGYTNDFFRTIRSHYKVFPHPVIFKNDRITNQRNNREKTEGSPFSCLELAEHTYLYLFCFDLFHILLVLFLHFFLPRPSSFLSIPLVFLFHILV